MYSTHTKQPQIRLIPHLQSPPEWAKGLPAYVIRPEQNNSHSAYGIVLLSLSPFSISSSTSSFLTTISPNSTTITSNVADITFLLHQHDEYEGGKLKQQHDRVQTFTSEKNEKNENGEKNTNNNEKNQSLPPIIDLLHELFSIDVKLAEMMIKNHIQLISRAINTTTDGLYIVLDPYPLVNDLFNNAALNPQNDNGDNKKSDHKNVQNDIKKSIQWGQEQVKTLLYLLTYYQEIAKLCDIGIPIELIISSVLSVDNNDNNDNNNNNNNPNRSCINFPLLSSLVDEYHLSDPPSLTNIYNNDTPKHDQQFNKHNFNNNHYNRNNSNDNITKLIKLNGLLPPRTNYQIYTIPNLVNFALPTTLTLSDLSSYGLSNVLSSLPTPHTAHKTPLSPVSSSISQLTTTPSLTSILDFPLSRVICHIIRSITWMDPSFEKKNSQDNNQQDVEEGPNYEQTSSPSPTHHLHPNSVYNPLNSTSNRLNTNTELLTSVPITIFTQTIKFPPQQPIFPPILALSQQSSTSSDDHNNISSTQGSIADKKQSCDVISLLSSVIGKKQSSDVWREVYSNDPLINLIISSTSTNLSPSTPSPIDCSVWDEGSDVGSEMIVLKEFMGQENDRKNDGNSPKGQNDENDEKSAKSAKSDENTTNSFLQIDTQSGALHDLIHYIAQSTLDEYCYPFYLDFGQQCNGDIDDNSNNNNNIVLDKIEQTKNDTKNEQTKNDTKTNITIPHNEENLTLPSHPLPQILITPYKHCCIGGSFDHLHTGHHSLLLSAMLLGSEGLFLGITANKMLQKKQFLDQMEPWERRVGQVMSYCQLFKGSCGYVMNNNKFGDECCRGNGHKSDQNDQNDQNDKNLVDNINITPYIPHHKGTTTTTNNGNYDPTTIPQFRCYFGSHVGVNVKNGEWLSGAKNNDKNNNNDENNDENNNENNDENNNENNDENNNENNDENNNNNENNENEKDTTPLLVNTPHPSLPTPSQFVILIEPLYDMYGPSTKYHEIECLVLSQEVEKGGSMVNNKRKKEGRSENDLFIVPLLILPQAEPQRIGGDKVDGDNVDGCEVNGIKKDGQNDDNIVNNNDNNNNNNNTHHIIFVPSNNTDLKVSSTDFRQFFHTITHK